MEISQWENQSFFSKLTFHIKKLLKHGVCLFSYHMLTGQHFVIVVEYPAPPEGVIFVNFAHEVSSMCLCNRWSTSLLFGRVNIPRVPWIHFVFSWVDFNCLAVNGSFIPVRNPCLGVSFFNSSVLPWTLWRGQIAWLTKRESLALELELIFAR